MKISESMIHLSSFHSSREADAFHRETLRQQRPGTAGGDRRPRVWNPEDNPEVWVDRVSITSHLDREIQSEYAAGISSRSRVSSPNDDTIDDTVTAFASQQLVEKMVGQAIDRQVTLRTLRNGEAVPRANELAGGRPTGPTETLVSMTHTKVHYEEEQMGFSSRGHVKTHDGREIDFSMDLSLDRAFLSTSQETTLVHTWKEKARLVDPLVISLDGGVPELTDTRFEFDLDSDGRTEAVSFVAKGSGFLSFDRNGDHQINNGSELFGPGTGNGFGELAAHDLDGNQWIDESDAVFSQLSVWTRDDQGNDRLISLKEAGVGAIFLGNASAEFRMAGMDNGLKGQVRRWGNFLYENGNVGSVGQIDLAVRAADPPSDTQALKAAAPAGDSVRPARPVFFPDPGTVPTVLEADDRLDNPLQALMDQIEQLKKELRQLLGEEREENGHKVRKPRRPDPWGVPHRSWGRRSGPLFHGSL